MRRFDEHSIELASREGWSSVHIGTARRTGPRADWNDNTLLCVDLDHIVERVRALAAIPTLQRVELDLLFGLPERELTSCLELLSVVPELAVAVIGIEQLAALAALPDAVELRLNLGRSDRDHWNTALDDLLPTLSRMPGLSGLALLGGGLDARRLAHLEQLRELKLHSVQVSHAQALGGLRLRRFVGWGLSNTPALVAEVVAMDSLVELTLRSCAIDDETLPVIARASGIEALRLPSNEVHGAGLTALASLPLHTLDLSRNPVAPSLHHLARLPSLRVLELQSVDLRGHTCRVLAGMERLVELDLGSSHVGQSVAPLVARMRSLQVLRLGGCDLVDVGFVSGLQQLRVLDLEGVSHLSRLAVQDVISLRSLEDLVLHGDDRLGVSVAAALSELPQLSALDLTICNLVPDHLRELARSTSLRRLKISLSDIGDAGVRTLAPLSKLALLDASRCKIGDAGAASIAENMPHLRYLDLANNHLSDVGAKAVMGGDRLLWLDLRSNHIAHTERTLPDAHLRIDEQLPARPPPVPEPRFIREIDEQLERAFDGVPVPEPPSRTLYQAEAEDSYETCDRSRDHLGRWQDLPPSHIADCQCAMSYLDAHGYRYYLPAMIRADLQGLLEPAGRYDYTYAGLDFHLTPGSSNCLRDYTAQRFALLDVYQRAAIAAWVHATQNDADIRDAWQRVVEHDASGDPGDWFNAFWPG